jgi:hypothetical protein
MKEIILFFLFCNLLIKLFSCFELTNNMACGEGEIISFERNHSICQVCEENTYAYGKNLSTNDIIFDKFFNKYFKTQCYQTNSSGLIYKSTCIPIAYYKHNNELRSGSVTQDGESYIFDMLYDFSFEIDGFLEFEYLKINKNSVYFNSEFSFLVDDDILISNKEETGEWEYFKMDLNKGFHSFLWTFSFYLEKEINLFNTSNIYDNFEFRMRNLKFVGLFQNNYKCLSCIKSVNNGNSALCYHCPENTYLDKKNRCLPCTEESFSFENSKGQKSCFKKTPCIEDDYEIIKHSTQIIKKLKVPVRCIDVNNNTNIPLLRTNCSDGYFWNSSFQKCEICPLGTFSNTKTNFFCQTCEEGFYPILTFIFPFHQFDDIPRIYKKNSHFKTFCYDKVSNSSCDYKFNFIENKIFTEKFIPNHSEIVLMLRLDFNIIDEYGTVIIKQKIKFKNNLREKIMLLVDGFELKYYNISTSDTFNFNLQKGTHYLEWIYLKESFEYEIFFPSLEINYIYLSGVNIGSSSGCEQCKVGLYKNEKDDKLFCSKNAKNSISNLESNTPY